MRDEVQTPFFYLRPEENTEAERRLIIKQAFNRGILLKSLETFFGVAQIGDHGVRPSSVPVVRRLGLEIQNNIKERMCDIVTYDIFRNINRNCDFL